MYLEVKRTAENGHTEEVWTFWVTERLKIVVDTYGVWKRPSRRHKLKLAQGYTRLNHRDPGRGLREADVPLPEDVRAEAVRQLTDMIQVGFWQRDFEGRV